MEFELEIIGTSVESCVEAEQGGATRIELCASMCDGGTTPPFSLIQASVRKLTIPVYVMIRPRGGDFLYSDAEFELMLEDIKLCKHIGVQGIVTGILNANGSVDKKRNGILVDLAYPMAVTFHRAFDRCSNPQEAVNDIIGLGFERILTSGQKPSALQGATLLKDLINTFGKEIIIMPGSGIDENNILAIARETGALEFHLSAKSSKPGSMQFANPDMKEDLLNPSVNIQQIRSIATKLRGLNDGHK
jgi:copper homeostasis protein